MSGVVRNQRLVIVRSSKKHKVYEGFREIIPKSERGTVVSLKTIPEVIEH